MPPKPNATAKEHQEYLRKGVCNVLLAYNIDTGQRYLQVTTTKTKADYAQLMDWLVQTHYPDAPKIKLIQDNYATHSYGAFYEHLPLDTARDLRHRLEFHFTPKHGSWPNMAEIEFSALSRQCLDRRIGTQQRLEEEALCWEAKRNAAAVKVNWSFTTEKARDKLKNRYAELTKITSKTKSVEHYFIIYQRIAALRLDAFVVPVTQQGLPRTILRFANHFVMSITASVLKEIPTGKYCGHFSCAEHVPLHIRTLGFFVGRCHI
ncbi:transposase [Hymenobacter siberiensis]|uniref:transposase n=1 Tax=Hymenobacter siberiensis TaxID=2848396 RepID=UPI001D0193A9|nr:transposase [Hymenobacter siberiensis]